jgi:hypothetical protein
MLDGSPESGLGESLETRATSYQVLTPDKFSSLAGHADHPQFYCGGPAITPTVRLNPKS